MSFLYGTLSGCESGPGTEYATVTTDGNCIIERVGRR